MDIETFLRELPGRYADPEVVARSERGAVVRARDSLLNRVVALKVLAVEGELGETGRARFHREASVLAGLDHPGLVKIHDIQTAPCPWMVMGFVEGRPLARILEEEGALPAARALAIAGGILEALGAAHAAGVVHRNLEPGNVLLADGDRVTLLDFGFASLAPSDEATLGGPVLARMEYAAPEVVREEPPTAASDLYSLGVLVYEMLTRKRPLGATKVLAHAFEARRPLRARLPEVDPELEALVESLLALDPAGRPGTGSALAEVRACRDRLAGTRAWLPPLIEGVRDVLHPLKNRLALVRRHRARPERARELLGRPAVREETLRWIADGEAVLAAVREAGGEEVAKVAEAAGALAATRRSFEAEDADWIAIMDRGYAAVHALVVEVGELEREEVFAPGEIVREAAARARGEGLALEAEVHPELEGARRVPDPRAARAAFGRALDELLANARGAGARRARVLVGFEGEDLVLRVQDDGPGLPDLDPEELFRAGVTHGKEEGTGRGLGDARSRVAALGGTLRVLPAGAGGAAFELRLPAGEPESEGSLA